MKRKKKILVLMGGPSSEYEVSLKTGKNVFAALPKQYRGFSSVVPRNNPFPHLFAELKRIKPDVVFIAMHGAFGEDGTIQGMLDTLGIPYIGSGALASALAMDKEKSSHILRYHGLRVPDFQTIKKGMRAAARRFPVIVKPASCGSSVGVTLVRKPNELKSALNHAFRYDNRVMLQRYIKGREVTCGVLDDQKTKKPFALPPTEIIPETSSFFDYRAKYMPHASREITPALLPPATTRAVQKTAIEAHRALGCMGVSRTDMIIAGRNIYVLETNTIPGMTKTSLLPQAAEAAGIDFPSLIDTLIISAYRR